MKVLWTLPDVERNFYVRAWEEELEIKKTTVWYKGPKNKKWWKIKRDRVEYYDCYTRRKGFRGPEEGILPCSRSCYWSTSIKRWRHKQVCTWSKEHSNWIRQEKGLCIDRNLTSWMFRYRYRRNKAATTIQRWYKAIFPFRLFKRAKAHFNSYVNYEPRPAKIVQDPSREAGFTFQDERA